MLCNFSFPRGCDIIAQISGGNGRDSPGVVGRSIGHIARCFVSGKGRDMTEAQVLPKPKVFYGYWMLAIAFFCCFIHGGYGMYGFGLFVSHLQKDFDWSRGAIMTAFTICSLIGGFTHPITGRLVNRYGAGKVIAAGSLAMGLGFILLSRMNNIWNFYAGYAIIGVGLSAIGTIPASYVVSNWFKKRRGMAIGVMSAGIGTGGFILARFIGGYLIPGVGWRTSYLVMALFVWLLIPLGLLLIKSKPADMGLYPDGVPMDEANAGTKAKFAASEGFTLKMALYTSAFWLICLSFVASGFGHVGVVQSQVPYLEDIGFPLAADATALSSVALGSLFGKLFFGWLCDKIQAKYACAIGVGLELIATCIIINTNQTTPITTMWLYAIVMGLGMGSNVPTLSLLVSTNFGLTSYGVIYGMTSLAQSLGSAPGPSVAGYMYDATHTYHQAFIIFAIVTAVSVAAVLAVRPPKIKKIKNS